MSLRYAVCCLFLCLTLLPAAALPNDSSDTDTLAGVWGIERILGPSVRGELSIDGRTSEWRAEIGGYDVPVRRTGDSVELTLPAGQGEFRGRVSSNGQKLAGHWIQPPTLTGNSRYATPVRLERAADHVWRGNVQPFDDRLALYLVVQAAQGGSLRAFLRDPESNSGMGRSFAITRTGSHLVFTNPKRTGDRIEGAYVAGSDSLVLELPDFGHLEFTRRTRETAVGFYPATPPMDHYIYRPPVSDGDGWDTASLQEAGLNPEPIATLIQQILDTQPDWYTSPYIQGLLIARHNKLVLEHYFYGFSRERTHDLRSAAKTITGTLVGIALDHGAHFALDSAAYRLFPEYTQLANPDPRKLRITVQDLLTMNSGLACDDNDDDSPGNEERMYAQQNQPDYYKYTLDLPMARTPGDGTAVYCTAGINLLGGIVRNATGTSLSEFFERFFAEPLNIHTYHLNLSPTGDAYMGGGIYLRPRDALKLGQLYLSGGRWRGRQVVSKEWVERSLQQHSKFPASDYAAAHAYGFAWHIFESQVGGRRYQEYMAQGNGGQLVVVIPELDLVVMIDAGNYNNFPTWRKFYEELLPTYVIPAVTDAAAH